MKKTGGSYTFAEASRKMERFCAYQERCHFEVSHKLKRMGMNPEAIDQIMANLIGNNFLNEERFVLLFAQGKFSQKKWGKKRIAMELKQRQVSDYLIKVALRELDGVAYDDALHELALKRLGQIKDKHPLRRKRKLADYLLYRGWEPDKVYEKVQELIQ